MKKTFKPGLICSCLLLVATLLSGQRKMSLSDSKPNIYLCMNAMGSGLQNFQRQNNVGVVKLIGGADISKGKTLDLNKETLSAAIRRAFPDSLMQGIGALDWEGSELKALRSGTTGADFTDALNRLIGALDFAQQLRPNVLWGYYGLPFREFWNRNSSWKQNGNKIAPLLKRQDILFPSVYLLYDAGSVVGGANNHGYIQDNVDQALALGATLNKPVLPFIWHRYPDYKQVPVDVLKDQVNEIFSQSVSGRKVAGVVWWSADDYFYQTKNNVFVSEVGNKGDYHQYYDTLSLNYGRELLKAARSH